MPTHDLHHVAIKAKDLEKTVGFYTEVLGMSIVDRPSFGFPGAWLQMSATMIHLYGGETAQNKDKGYDRGSAAIDHIAIRASEFDNMKAKIIASGYPWRQANIKEAAIWQIFVKDPNDITIELNFESNREPVDSVGPTDENKYLSGRF